MTNSEIKCEQLRKLFEDHYWDTFESDKKIILKHIDFVLSLWNTRTPEPTKAEESLLSEASLISDRHPSKDARCFAKSVLDYFSNTTKSNHTVDEIYGLMKKIAEPTRCTKKDCECGGDAIISSEPTKAENGLVNKEIDKLVTDYCIRVRDWCKQNRVEYVGDFLIAPTIENFIKDTIIPKFSTPSITKEQLLATIDKAEKEYFSEGAYYRTDIPQGICNHIKQRIEELYNEKIN